MLKSKLVLGFAIAAVSIVAKAAPAAAAEQWYFWVENQGSAEIAEILVSQHQTAWGHFNLNHDIAIGEKMKLNWYKSTNNQSCNQWVKAVYSDGSETLPARIDFCENLDDPIVFSD
jgi:hypothetical protein